MDTRAVIARFEAEKQALALMDHPCIARVLDAGATASGRPYFVMELVRGRPVIEYCNAVTLSVRDRLGLFQDVCNAVQHAHQKGVIHRDIKPSNVLVAEIDGRAATKIIDFGIAKAMNARLAESTLMTEHRQLLGTPQYMSPEQADGSPDIDTRTDIYSLGVLLYELLTGQTPFDAERLRHASLAEVQRIIREEPPPRPSSRVLSGAASGAGPQSQASLRGDLDWIILKCLEKERARRYQTANALVLDIGRHLAGEPVFAAPPSRIYRAGKLLRRFRFQTAAAAIVAASLLVAVVGTATFAIRESRQRALVEKHSLEAGHLAGLQAEMLSGINAWRLGNDLRQDMLEQAVQGWRAAAVPEDEIALQRATLEHELDRINFTATALRGLERHVFDVSLARIESRFGDQPEIKATLLVNLAAVLRDVGLYEQAMGPLSDALAIRRRILPPDHPDTLAAVHDLGKLLIRRRRFEQAEPYAREAMVGRDRQLGPSHPDTLRSCYLLGYALTFQARPVEAERYLRRALDGQKLCLARTDPDVFATTLRLGQLLSVSGQLEEAEPYIQEAAALVKDAGPDDEGPIQVVWLLAGQRLRQNRIDEAKSLTVEAFDRLRQLRGDDYRDTLFLRSRMAWFMLREGRLDEADACLKDLLDRRMRALPDDHPDVLEVSRMAAELCARQGRLVESTDLYRALVARSSSTRGPAHRDTVLYCGELVDVLTAGGHLEEAAGRRDRCVRDVIDSLRTWKAEDAHPAVATPFYRLLSGIEDGGQRRAQFIQVSRDAYGPTDPRTLTAMHTVARHLTQSRNTLTDIQLNEAVSLCRESVALFRSSHPNADRPMLDAVSALAATLCRAGRSQEAIPFFDESKQAHLRNPSRFGPRSGEEVALHGGCLIQMGRYSEAENELNAAWAVTSGEEAPDRRVLIDAFCALYDAWHVAEPQAGHDEMARLWRSARPQPR